MEIVDMVIRLSMAGLMGGIIGVEREYRDKSAGFRTLIIIAVGAALFSIISLQLTLDFPDVDPSRIISYIVGGIGFLGAGVILKDGADVKGLTTAASVWLSAGVGAAAGVGYIDLAMIVTGITVFVLTILPFMERWIDNIHDYRAYKVQIASKADYPIVTALFEDSSLQVYDIERHMNKKEYWLHLKTVGSLSAHSALVDQLLSNKNVKGF